MTGLITQARGAGTIAGAAAGAEVTCGRGASDLAGLALCFEQIARSSSVITGLITHVLGDGTMPSAAADGAGAATGCGFGASGSGCAARGSRFEHAAMSSSVITGLTTHCRVAGASAGAVATAVLAACGSGAVASAGRGFTSR